MFDDFDDRAGLGVDRPADEADRAAGRRISCPTLVLWTTGDDMQQLYGDVLSVWAPWAPHLRGGPIESGHHIAEEAPDELVAELVPFLAGPSTGAIPAVQRDGGERGGCETRVSPRPASPLPAQAERTVRGPRTG